MSTHLVEPAAASRPTGPEPQTTMAQRLVWAVSGLGFLAFTTLGLLFASVFASAFYPSPFGAPFGPQTDMPAYFAANRPQVQAMSFVYSLAALSLLVFVAYSAGMLADRAPGRRSALPGLALGAGALAAGFWLLNALLLWVLSQPEAADAPGLLRSMHNLVYLAGGPAHILTLGIFLGAVSAALWRSSVLPRWIVWTGAAAAGLSTAAVLALLWVPASLLLPLGRGLAMLWILATSVALLVGRSGEAMVDADRPADDRPASLA
jgi:hypothetical protein